MDERVDTRARRSTTAEPLVPALPVQDRRVETGLLDLVQASRYLGTSERHLRRLWQERRIAAVKVGRRVRFTRRDLDAYIDANRYRAVR